MKSLPSFRPGVSGNRLSPLPYESSFSVFLRLCWMNAANGKELADISKCLYRNITDCGFSQVGWINSEWFAKVLEWECPSQFEISLICKIGKYWNIWRGGRLKYCPICLQCFYHTPLFQLVNLNHCPIHGCKLESTCMSCGAKSPTYTLESKIFNYQLLCEACLKPLSGAPIDIEDHLIFRQSSNEIGNKFSSYFEWLNDLNEIMLEDCLDFAKCNRWAKHIGLDNVINLIISYTTKTPTEIAPAIHPDLSFRYWKINMQCMPEKQESEGFYLSNRNEIFAVFYAVKRRLKKWAFSSRSEPKIQSLARKFVNTRNYEGWRPSELAYFHLFGVDECPFIPTRNPFKIFARWENRIPKIAIASYLYGIYAVHYYDAMIEISGKDGKRFGTLGLGVENDLVFMNRITRQGVNFGIVIGPNVPGLPINIGLGFNSKF